MRQQSQNEYLPLPLLLKPVFETAMRPGAHNALTLIDMTEHSRAVDKFVQLCEPAAQFGISCALEFAAWLGVSSIPAAQCNRERSRPSQRRRLFIHIDCPARRTEDVRQN
jgi:hypothetical protein